MINMGSVHYYLHQIDSAQYYFDQAEKVYTAIENTSPDEEKKIKLMHAELLNNMAAIDVVQNQYSRAEQRIKQALALLPDNNDYYRVLFLQSLGAVYDFKNKTNEARNCWQQAYEIALRIYGKDHHVTAELASYLAP
jgi:ATP/maltotriose-dependent transcriptional regulator MalT